MQFSRLAVTVLAVSVVLNAYAQEKPVPKTEPANTEPAKDQPSQDQSASKPAAGPDVDAVKMSGSTFESPYFKFTYELPAGWKTLDNAARIAANQQAAQEDMERSKVVVTKKASAKTPAKSAAATTQGPALAPERYSLLAASPQGLDSLASPILPRINIWAHRRIPPMDKAVDHAQLLASGKHNEILVRPQELNIEGRQFVRVELVNAAGNYQARYITVIGDFLVGFDFLTQSEKDMVEYANTIKSIRFE
jgi:hypothetical protein